MANLLEQIDIKRSPKHIAIIMDGNGRWAKKQGADRTVGHKAGIDALHRTLEAAGQAGVKYVTAYAFSTENWNRPKEEVDTIMGLVCYGVRLETQNLIDRGVRFFTIGDLNGLPEDSRKSLEYCIQATAHCDKVNLILAINYSSRWELVKTAQDLARKAANGEIKPEDINEEMVSKSLTTADFPDPDLLIRTGGEQRISNYLLWQISYSELYFSDTYWPDFGPDDIYKAIIEFQARERRFGKTSAQVQEEAKNIL